MEQKGGGGITRWLFLGLAVFLFMQYGWPLISGQKSAPDHQPIEATDTLPTGERAPLTTCTLAGARSTVQLTSHGGALSSARMLDEQYAVAVDKPGVQIDLVTTSRDERMPLRDDLRAPNVDDGDQLVPTSVLDYELVASTDTSCTFVHRSDSAEITKVVSATDRPFELDVTVTVKNVSSAPKKHRFATEQTSWRTTAETTSSFWDLGKKPEWMTEVVTHTTDTTERNHPDAFDPDDFDGEHFTKEKWLRAEGDGIWAAVSSNYFTSATIHVAGPSTPKAETLIEDGTFYGQLKGDPSYGHLFRARLAYAEKELAPSESAEYRLISFVGPKEREVLAAIGGGERDKFGASNLIDMGMFGAIGKLLLRYVYWLHSVVGVWGWVICLLTISVKILVFPLQLPSLKNGFVMRRLKPQIDEISEKYTDDLALKTAALQELYRREGIPQSKQMLGCLPMLLQMPVWISLYTGLATAVELYHVPFGPLIPDLSHADPYHVIPIVLGGSSFIQQKLMPSQGMDPAQQKMMLFMMPGILTAMMFFLPAGLGVYMLTNTWLGICQQLLVERTMRNKLKQPGQIEVREVKKGDDASPALALSSGTGASSPAQKRKVRARG